MSTIEIHGTVAEGFEEVREEFRAVVAAEDGQSGAQLAAYLRGRKVVDLWAGPEVTDTTLTGLHSSSKGAAGLVVALLIQDGALDIDRPVAHYWPRFAAAGKEDITVRDVLVHRSGVIGVGGGFTVAELADEGVIAERLVGQRPYFAPRTAHGYGGFVMYAILGRVVRAVTGSTVQQLFEQRIRAPYGLDVYLGLPAELDHRYLPILPWRATAEMEAAFAANSPNPQGIAGISYNLNAKGFTAADVMALPNDPQLRRLGQASAGGVGSARGLARMYAAAVSGVDGRSPLAVARHHRDRLRNPFQRCGSGPRASALHPRLRGERAAVALPRRARVRACGLGRFGRIRRSAQRSHLRIHPSPCRIRFQRPGERAAGGSPAPRGDRLRPRPRGLTFDSTHNQGVTP